MVTTHVVIKDVTIKLTHLWQQNAELKCQLQELVPPFLDNAVELLLCFPFVCSYYNWWESGIGINRDAQGKWGEMRSQFWLIFCGVSQGFLVCQLKDSLMVSFSLLFLDTLSWFSNSRCVAVPQWDLPWHGAYLYNVLLSSSVLVCSLPLFVHVSCRNTPQ